MSVNDFDDFDALPLRTRHRIVVSRGDGAATGTAMAVPVTVLVGQSLHPRVVLMAGVHGDEYEGIRALQELAQEIDPSRLRGTVVVVPVANPLAFAAAQRRTPDDNVDLNRVFPGRADGCITERLADLLCRRVLRQANLVFALHGAMSSGELAPWIEFLDLPTPLGRATYDAARASGFPDLIALPLLPGTLQTALAADGIPVIEGEVGGRGAMRDDNVQYYKKRARAVLRHVGILLGEAPPSSGDDTPRIWTLDYIRSGASGILIREKGLRDEVDADGRLGTVVDAEGVTVAEVRSLRAGVIGSTREHAGVRPDDTAFIVWVPTQPQSVARTEG